MPILGAEDAPPAQEPAGPPAPPAAPSEPAYPANTPLEQMTAEQQAAYWKAQSRKHEDRSKAFGALTPEQLAELRAKADRQDALEAEMSDGLTKAVAEAKKATASEADAKYQPMLVETAFRIAIGDRKTPEETADFIGDLNLTRFLGSDGQVDTAKVLARVEQFAPATGTRSPVRGPIVHSHFTSGTTSKPGEQGLAMAEKRFGKKP